MHSVMAKKSKQVTRKRSSAVGSKWPTSGALTHWLECYLDSCEQCSKPSRGAIRACTSLRQLAECGLEAQALKRVDRLVALLDPTDIDALVRLKLVAAEICLEIPNLKRAEKNLASLKTRLPDAGPSKRKFLTRFTNSFLVVNGLAEEENAVDERYQLGKYRQQYRLSFLAGDHRSALAAIGRATKLIPEVDDFILERGLILSAIRAYRRLGKDDEVAKYVNSIDRNGYSNNLDTGSLWAMGLETLAIKRSEKIVLQRLKVLKTDDDPNIHFPVDEICEELWFLLRTGESATAAKLLRRALRELPHWPGLSGEFASSGALTLFAEVLAEIDGPDAARQLLEHAVDAATVERHRGFRQSSLNAANQRIETLGNAAAIISATTIRNGKKRRETLTRLYAECGDWSQVAAQLNDASSADEVHQLIHTVLFALPGGNRL
jgi:tetratricopeptide (TPR) repeat protein